MDQVTRYQIRQKVKKQILTEHLGEKPANVLYESGAIVTEGFGDFLKGVVNKAGGLEGMLPDAAVASVKKYFVAKLFKSMGITGGSPIAEFIENLIVYIPLADFTKVLTRTIDCNQFNEILLKAATQTVTNLGIKKVLPPLVHYFSQYELNLDFGDGKPLAKRKKGGKDLKGVSIKEVDAMLDTVFGVLGETVVSQIIYGLIKDKLLQGMGTFLCDMVGIKGAATAAGDEGFTTLANPGKFNHPVQGLEVIDAPVLNQLPDKSAGTTALVPAAE